MGNHAPVLAAMLCVCWLCQNRHSLREPKVDDPEVCEDQVESKKEKLADLEGRMHIYMKVAMRICSAVSMTNSRDSHTVA